MLPVVKKDSTHILSGLPSLLQAGKSKMGHTFAVIKSFSNLVTRGSVSKQNFCKKKEDNIFLPSIISVHL